MLVWASFIAVGQDSKFRWFLNIFHCDIRSSIIPQPHITRCLTAGGMVHTTFFHGFNPTWHNCLTSSIIFGLRPNLYSFWSSVLMRPPQNRLTTKVTELLEWPALWFLNTTSQFASEPAIESMIPRLLCQLLAPLVVLQQYTQMPRGPSFVVLVPSIILSFPPPLVLKQASNSSFTISSNFCISFASSMQ